MPAPGKDVVVGRLGFDGLPPKDGHFIAKVSYRLVSFLECLGLKDGLPFRLGEIEFT